MEALNMGYHEKKSYLMAIYLRYMNASRPEKQKILDEFCAVCGYNRKYAIRLLKKEPKKPKRKSGPKPIYNDLPLIEALKRFWYASNQSCSQKLKVIIAPWLPCYEDVYGPLSSEIKNKLLTISTSTIDRMLKPTRKANKLKGRCTTKPGILLKSQIEMQFSHWDIQKPGFLEADTVAHCGTSIAGCFAWSLTVTDICTGWTENRAMWNKEGGPVYERISDVETTLPFEVLGFDCDNGAEFINHALYDYFVKRPKPVAFTRSRPYKKNDNAHVEQKNWTHVRNLFGYERLEKFSVVEMMNDLYRKEWGLYQNHFIPTMKLLSKQRTGCKYKKKYETPKTPYERLLESTFVDDATKAKLKAVHESLNPFKLKQEIERKLLDISKVAKINLNVINIGHT